MSGLESSDYWPYIWASYALTLGGLGVLASLTVQRLLHWSRKAAALDTRASEPPKESP
jgi:heme exporter protein D